MERARDVDAEEGVDRELNGRERRGQERVDRESRMRVIKKCDLVVVQIVLGKVGDKVLRFAGGALDVEELRKLHLQP